MTAPIRFRQIRITDYKNYDFREFHFTERITGICGLNGKGKTNLLDAIYYLCLTKSYFTRSDAINVNFGKEGFRLEGYLSGENQLPVEIVCIYRANGKKEVFLDGAAYEKFSEHVGKFPVIFIAPDDIALITGASEERRRYIDALLCQLDKQYLSQLILYNKLLSDRNGVLRYESRNNRLEPVLLQTIDDQLIPAGEFIFNARKEFLDKLFPLIQTFYKNISGGTESIRLRYESQLHKIKFHDLLSAALEKDRAAQRTGTGIHRDELSFEMNGNLFRPIASQGQRKSLLFACRFAAFEIIKKEKGFAPILLLDDIFEKLDEKRMHQLLEFICIQDDGQVFITDTDATRLREAIRKFDQPVQIIQLN